MLNITGLIVNLFEKVKVLFWKKEGRSCSLVGKLDSVISLTQKEKRRAETMKNQQNTDPEFVSHEKDADPSYKVTLRDRLNLFGFIRFLLGTVRDSSGRPNNILMCFYASMAIFAVGMWWGTHPGVTVAPIRVICQSSDTVSNSIPVKRNKNTRKKKQKTKRKEKSKKKKGSGRRVRRRRRQKLIFQRKPLVRFSQSCRGAKINVTVNVGKPPALPSSFFWVLILFPAMLLVAYVARRPETRRWLLDLALAKWASGKGVSQEHQMDASKANESSLSEDSIHSSLSEDDAENQESFSSEPTGEILR